MYILITDWPSCFPDKFLCSDDSLNEFVLPTDKTEVVLDVQTTDCISTC